MHQLITRARQSSFLRYNTLFFIGSVITGVLNYLFYPVIGRLLTPGQFGEVQTLVSFFLQATTFLMVFGMVSVNILATYQDKIKAHTAVFELEKLSTWASLIPLAIMLVLQVPLQVAFKFESPWPFTAIAIAFVASVPSTFRSAYLRSARKFGQSSVVYILGAAGKLLLAVTLILLGWGTIGAIIGIIAAQIISFEYSAIIARRVGFRPRGSYWRLPHVPSVLPELKYSVLVLLSSLIVMMLFSVDTIIIKYLFDPQTAGLYAGVATVARIIFFLTLPISQVLLPLISLRHTAPANRAVLLKSLALTIAVGLPVLAACLYAPGELTHWLMGKQYVGMAHLLPLLSTAIFVLSIGNLFVLYHMALRRWGVAIVVGLCAIIMFVLMVMRHTTPQIIVENLLIGSLCLLALLAGWAFLLTRQARPENQNLSSKEPQ